MEAILNKDLSELTGVDKQILDKLVCNINYCICNYIEKSMLDNEQVCKINIGIGILILKISNDSMQWYFTPSKDLESNVVTALESQQNPLTPVITKKLIDQLLNFYDRMF